MRPACPCSGRQQSLPCKSNGSYSALSRCVWALTIAPSTPTADVVFATETTTLSYTDIIVSLTTETLTVTASVTATNEVLATTVVTASAGAKVTVLPRRRKRSRCAANPSTTAPVSSSEPAVTSTSVLFPIASECPTLEEYSSACSCVTAVDATQTVTASAATSTSVIVDTASTGIPSTSVSTITTVVTDTVAGTVTTTRTITSTTTVPVPSSTAKVIITSGVAVGKEVYVIASSGFIRANGVLAASVFSVSLASSGGPVSMASNSDLKLAAASSGSTGVSIIGFYTESAAATNGYLPVTCTVNSATSNLACQTTTGGLSVLLVCSTYMYLATPAVAANLPSGCTLATWAVEL